jgi:hypothetical protein
MVQVVEFLPSKYKRVQKEVLDFKLQYCQNKKKVNTKFT